VIVHLVWGFLRLFLLISDPANSEVIFAVESEIGISGERAECEPYLSVLLSSKPGSRTLLLSKGLFGYSVFDLCFGLIGCRFENGAENGGVFGKITFYTA
jgi:hypothetical protein